MLDKADACLRNVYCTTCIFRFLQAAVFSDWMRDTRQWNAGPNTSPGPQPLSLVLRLAVGYSAGFVRLAHVAAGSLTTSPKKATLRSLKL